MHAVAAVTTWWRHHDDLLLPGTCFAAGVGAVVLAASDHANAVDLDVVRLGAWMAGPVAGALVLDRLPGHLVGRLLAASGLFPVLALVVAAWEQRTLPDIASAASEAPVLAIPAVGLIVGLLVAMPEGRLVGTGRRLAGAAAGVALLGVASAAWRAAQPGPAAGDIADRVLSRVEHACLIALLAAVVFAISLQWRAAAESTGTERRRRLWLLAGAAVVTAGAVSSAWPGLGLAAVYASAALHAVVPFGIALLLVADDLPPVEPAVGHALLLALTLGVGLAVFALAGAVLSRTRLPDQRAAAVTITAIAGLALLPLHVAGRRRLAVRLHGVGRQPASLLALLGGSMGHGSAGHDALLAACEAVALAVRSPRATVVPERARGAHDPAAATVELLADGQHLGLLIVAPRRPGEPFNRRDSELIAVLAGPVAQVARAAVMAGALERAKADIAAQRLVERRRIRRDLHDGLGPLLASLALQIDTVARTHPELERAVARITGTVALSRVEVRRLVEGLAPEGVRSAELGHSVRELVEGWASAVAPTGMRIGLDVDADLPPVSEDVRVTAYRIVGEALTNAVRHASATECRVSLSRAADGGIEVEVRDNGSGMQHHAAGFGLRSMSERASSVGGTLAVTTDAGTVVHLTVPACPTDVQR
jgi:signal transduction histidine kinase